ncbi:hypothetical protein P0M11_10625 [Kaistella sp. PBT33-4]|nr:hypothetical protein [Kaistella sp. PBT33-4]MDF0720450.1 hypothetical protein [Kaistella sp. PBT33-4]
MTFLFQQQQAGLGLIGWIIVFAAFYFLKDVVFKKDKPNDKIDQPKSE